ncbi:MAG: metallophosphoesterase family protein [Bdellovibrionales bacterium]
MPPTPHALPPNLRLYAIGDIHGRSDLLGQLLEKIARDSEAKGGTARLVFLGDYVDRGLYSRQVIDRLIELKATEPEPPVFLMGNHEQVMRELLRGGENTLLQDWLRFGGRETLMSYGINPMGPPEAVIDALREKTPRAHAEFLEKLDVFAEFGDYFFCHAGIKPGIDLARQTEQDLCWIRYEFLGQTKPHPKMIVHGHTIAAEPELKPNRINIDTGAYATGCLTALGLEGTKKWLLQTK